MIVFNKAIWLITNQHQKDGSPSNRIGEAMKSSEWGASLFYNAVSKIKLEK